MVLSCLDMDSPSNFDLDKELPLLENPAVEDQCLAGILIFHVGPSKTGTSSIQCTLQRLPFLKNSSYSYVGRYENERKICSPSKYPLQDLTISHQRFFPQNIVFGSERIKKKAAWHIKKRLIQLNDEFDMNSTISSGNVPYRPHNAILSAEEFEGMVHQDEKTWNLLRDTLSPYEGRTRVIVTYRNFFEIFVSLYYELAVGRTTPSSWNNSKIIPLPTFWSTEGTHNLTDHLTSKVVAAYEGHSFNVSIFEFHGRRNGKTQGDDMISRFICQLPCAEAACTAYLNDILKSGKDVTSRPSLKAYSQYDRIAKEAYERGLLAKYDLQRTKNSRKAAVRGIENYIVNKLGIKYTELPLKCLNKDELDTILKISIEDGKGVMKHTFDEEEHLKLFQVYLDKKEFCTVDVDALMRNNEWVQFLQNDLFSSDNTNKL